MRIYINLFFLGILFFSACNSKEKTPAGVIAKDQMAGLLTDVHIVNGTLYATPQMPDSLYKYGMGKYLNVFKQYHTDSTQFKKSIIYYASKPDELENIYQQVMDNLKAKQDSLNKPTQKKTNALPKK
jgi:hypothetical protein